MPVLQQVRRRPDTKRDALAAGITGMGQALGQGLMSYASFQQSQDQLARTDAANLAKAALQIPMEQRGKFIQGFAPIIGEKAMAYLDQEALSEIEFKDGKPGEVGYADKAYLKNMEKELGAAKQNLDTLIESNPDLDIESIYGQGPDEVSETWGGLGSDKHSNEHYGTAKSIKDAQERVGLLQKKYENALRSLGGTLVPQGRDLAISQAMGGGETATTTPPQMGPAMSGRPPEGMTAPGLTQGMSGQAQPQPSAVATLPKTREGAMQQLMQVATQIANSPQTDSESAMDLMLLIKSDLPEDDKMQRLYEAIQRLEQR